MVEIKTIDADNVEVVFRRQYTKKQIEDMKARMIASYDEMLAAFEIPVIENPI